MDHIGKWITVFLTFAHHSWYIIPRISVILHSFDNLNDSINISYIFLNILGFEFVDILFLLKFSDSFILILFDLVILFPGDSLDILLFLMLTLFVVDKIFRDSFIESCILLAWLSQVFCIFVWRKLKILDFRFFLLLFGRWFLLWLFLGLFVEQVSFVFRFQVLLQKVKANLTAL